MLIHLIQLLFFLSSCPSLQAMNAEQKNIVRTKLYEKHEVIEAPQPIRTVLQPLSDLKLHGPTIKAKHIQELYNNNQNEQALHHCKKIIPHMPDDLSMLRPKTKNAYESIQNTVKKNAFNGNKDAQILLTEHYIQKLHPVLNSPEFLEKIKFQHCLHAYELLNFTAILKNNSISITIPEHNKRELFTLRDITDPVTSYLIQATLYLQSINQHQNDTRYSMLLDKKCPENPEVEIACQFLINYGDSSLSDEEVVKKFIKTITSQKKSSHILSAIAESPLFSNVIHKLGSMTLNNNDPLIADFYYILAELHYKNKNYTQANNYYKKNKVYFLKEKKVQFNAFNTYVSAKQSFNKQDINYLSSLVGNIYNQFKKLDKIDPNLSYRIGLLTQALIHNNLPVDPLEKITIIFNGLEHLAYAQKDGNLDTTKHKKINILCIDLHTSLSTIYKDKNDIISALKHTKHALQYRSQSTQNRQDTELYTILDQAEKNNPDLYTQYAPCTKIIVDFIDNKHDELDKQKNYTPLSEYVSSDLCQQLIPYCEQAYKKNKHTNNAISYIIALNHKNNGNYRKACEYIETLSHPLSHAALSLKAHIYSAIEKTLPESELASIFKSFINTKKASSDEHNTILSLIMSSNGFFIQTNNHALAIKLIAKLSNELPNTPREAIQLAFFIANNLIATKNSSLNGWKQELKSCQFYQKFADPSCYDGNTNVAAGLLLHTTPNHEKSISYFIAALDSKELLTETTEIAQKTISKLYYEWATTITNDKELCLNLLNKAMQYDNTAKIRYKTAICILQNSNEHNLITQALQLLEENIKQNCPEKTFSQIALAQAYCHYSPIAAQQPILQQCIPLDIDKGISYLKEHNQEKELLKALTSICAGESLYIPNHLSEKYKNIPTALEYITILINNEPNNIDYISLRLQLHEQIKQFDKALNDINCMLNAPDLSNTRGITKEILLLKKIDLLLSNIIDDTIYDQLFECFKQLDSCKEKSMVNLTSLSPIQKHTDYLIVNEIMTDNAIEWCCYMADSIITSSITDPMPFATSHEKEEFTFYLFSAAEKGNVRAQLSLLPYLHAVYVADPTTEYFILALKYAHNALSNPIDTQNKKYTTRLIAELEKLTQQGIALACYILCDYYKKDAQKFEKTIGLFNQSKNQIHHLENITDTIKKICSSCRDILLKYVDHYVKNPKKGSLCDAIATFMLGSMYQYSDSEEMLTAASIYLGVAKEGLCNKFKLQQYLLPIHSFIGNTYYKKAILEEKTNDCINFELLRKSAQIGWLPAVYKLAKIYIEDHKNGNKNRSVTTNDFVPLLIKDRDNPDSHKLLQEYLKTQNSIEKENPIVYNTNPAPLVATNKKVSSIEERMELITEFAHAKNFVKYKNYTETNTLYKAALQYNKQENKQKAAELLQKATRQHHPVAYMILALSHLTGELTIVDYKTSETLLTQALRYGLVPTSGKNKTKQFYNTAFLNTLLLYVESLLTGKCPTETGASLLSIIKQNLLNGGVNITNFSTLCGMINTIVLSSASEWITEKKIDQKETTTSTEKKTMVKNINNKEFSPELEKALDAYAEGNITRALELMHFAATIQKIPSACILLASNYLRGDGVEKSYSTSEKFLHDALAYGLVENQFLSNNTLSALCTYIDLIITTVTTPSSTKKYLLAIIKKALENNKISIADFCEIVHKETNINLPLHPEWSTEEKEEKKGIIKYQEAQETSAIFCNGIQAYEQKDIQKSINLMKLAATKEHHPTACIIISADYLKGKSVRKSYLWSEIFLRDALTYGVKTKTFYNSDFLNGLCHYIKTLLESTHPELIKQNLLSIIQQSLETHEILKEFYTAFQETTNIDLISHHEWSIHNNQKMRIFNSLKKSLIKDENSQEDSNNFVADIEEYQTKQTLTERYSFIKNIATQYPTSSMQIALIFLTEQSVNIDYDVSKFFLMESLAHGLSEGKFPNTTFLQTLFCYLEELTITDTPLKNLLPTIKKTLETHGINIAMLNTVFKESSCIDISLTPEWSTKEKGENNLIHNQDYQESPDCIAVQNAWANGNVKIALERAKNIAEKESHPTACIILSSGYLQGNLLKKSAQLSESFLKKSLLYGLVEQKFCHYDFLQALCNYMDIVITGRYPQSTKRTLLSIIKNTLQTNSIDLTVFAKVFKDATKIDLSTIPEWNT